MRNELRFICLNRQYFYICKMDTVNDVLRDYITFQCADLPVSFRACLGVTAVVWYSLSVPHTGPSIVGGRGTEQRGCTQWSSFP